jgi:hypothetical protein
MTAPSVAVHPGKSLTRGPTHLDTWRMGALQHTLALISSGTEIAIMFFKAGFRLHPDHI